MSEQITIKCDHCGTDLRVDSPMPANYGLQLESVNFGINSSGVTCAIHMEPPLKEPLQFCGFGCLRDWMDEEKR